jgi:hypothetical protein
MATPNYDINYDDARFTKVENDKNAALKETGDAYDKAITNNTSAMDKALADIEAAKQQSVDAANKQTELAIDKLEQQQEWARQDYIKEQSGAYKDYQKQSNQYGVNAEQMAASGMTDTGYSESSQVSMYNTYQNRIAVARESYQRTVDNFALGMAEARAQNSSVLAEIYAQAMARQLEATMHYTTQNNNLLVQKTEAQNKVKNDYYQRYLAVIAQINEENKLAEDVRQHEDEMAYKEAALKEEKRQFDILHPTEYGMSGASTTSINPGKGGSSGGSKSSSSKKKIGGKSSVKTGTSKVTSGMTKADTKSSAEIDMNSVLALGYGPISASRLSELVAEGKIKKYYEGGKIKFKKVVTLPTASLGSGSGFRSGR